MGKWVGKNKAEHVGYPKKQDTFESEGTAVNNYQDDRCDWALSLIMMFSPSKGHKRSTRSTGKTDKAGTFAYTKSEDPACTQRQPPNEQV